MVSTHWYPITPKIYSQCFSLNIYLQIFVSQDTPYLVGAMKFINNNIPAFSVLFESPGVAGGAVGGTMGVGVGAGARERRLCSGGWSWSAKTASSRSSWSPKSLPAMKNIKIQSDN